MRRSLGLAALLLVAGQAHADYKDSYRKGIEALDRKRWDDVVRHMREAVAGNPTEGERLKLYGLRFEVYLPHFYLGAAYLNQGHCDLAVKEFETSRSQGAIRSHPKYAELLDGLKSCEGQVARVPSPTPTPTAKPAGPDPAAVAQAVQAAEAALARADESARALSRLSADPVLAPVWTREPALGPAEGEAREALAGARAKLDTGRRASDLALLSEAREQAGRARDRFESVRQVAERRREALARTATASPTPVSPTPSPTAPGRREAVSPELLAGAQAFFDGRYEDALRQLERAAEARGRPAAQVALFRAAASYAQFRAGGEKDEALRRRAAEAVAACRRADPSLAPDAAFFSPSFAEFFRSTP